MLSIRSLNKSFRQPETGRLQPVLVDVSLEVEAGEFFTLLGPSGCGKSTTLRCVAGLEGPDSGEIRIKDRVVFSSGEGTNVAAEQRLLGMVHQSYAVWPHMTVFDNVAFPLKIAQRRAARFRAGSRADRPELKSRVEELLGLMRLDGLENRPTPYLSGGQQQRVALARALAVTPHLLLLDEPLSNLDAALRGEMWFELRRLQEETGVTTLYVTHDQREALAMSNRIAVMLKGVVQQVGRPREIYESPRNRFVASFVGKTNLIAGTVTRLSSDGMAVVATSLGEMLGRATCPEELQAGRDTWVSVRPEKISVRSLPEATGRSSRTDTRNVVEGVVRQRAFLGDAVEHIVDVAGMDFHVAAAPDVSLAPGSPVELSFAASTTVVVCDSTQMSEVPEGVAREPVHS
jgi:iron(III) transport system ATP-binding protein